MRNNYPPAAASFRGLRLAAAYRWLWIGLLVVAPLASAAGQEPPASEPPASEAAADPAPAAAPDPAAGPDPAAEISDEVRSALEPLVRRLSTAESLRATVKMSVASAVGDEVLGTNQGLFQIASATPNRLALTAKFQSEAVHFVSDGEHLHIQLTPEAYVVVDAPESFAQLASAMPVQLGPQPEPMLWLTLAGVDPSESLLSGLTSIEVVGHDPVGETPAVQLRGVRPEGVRWDLSISTGDRPRPLSLVIDITEMITRANNLQVPEGYSFSIRYEFERWEIGAPLAAELFTFQPPADAERFDSIADYLLQANEVGPHPLLGQPAPKLEAEPLTGDPLTIGGEGDSVVVLEFWATWCAPCVEALPKMAEIADRFAERGVKFYAVNVSEDREAVETFLKERELELPVLLDPEGQIARAYGATAIPQTVLIGKGGRVEAVHVGFDMQESPSLISDELETLLAGRRIYDPKEVEEPAAQPAANEDGEDADPAAKTTDDSASDDTPGT